mmetsp:Transcript_30432/g.72989  ORF Transcript_30432/g.72989 Transcript_30432/m.72989 type:complete len:315 (-) Transcript_30432:200-1144(-)|eukprot:CAMPEP_0113628276 /NCGR_PEP_ID=MMETSP0017_2-20120614/14650_1 /TAXON_ID=2856 /ORGANISM="Cylindrotheca closterium" /LENGTH=314 /DNA_ID=CAMNT_0000538573 /DNA_START=123 /DNA_END=1067 /DNA_ORIENTATION=- /assembly_acc=CAM_ASM_000147
MKIQSFGLLSLLSVVSCWTCGSAFVPRSMVMMPKSSTLVDSPSSFALSAAATDIDLPAVRSALGKLVKDKNCGPILIRLAWHDAGTYSKEDESGGPRGVMRLEGEQSEANFGANNGLDIARDLIANIKEELAADMSYADFWALASIVAIEEMGGPKVTFRMGRKDATKVEESVPEGRHPDGDKGSDHLREVFGRMGLTDQDIVILSGAHTVGSCHLDRSGFDGPWTEEPFKFDNAYYVDMINKDWKEAKSNEGNPQFNSDANTMMLISDLALMEDEKFRVYVDKYAEDQDAFFSDFAESYQKLLELGCKDLQEA